MSDKESTRKRPLDQEDEEQTEDSGGPKGALQNTTNSVAKRVRQDTESDNPAGASTSSASATGSQPSSSSRSNQNPTPDHGQQSSSQQQRHRPPRSLAFFGTDVIDDVVQTIGQFLFEHCHHANVEVFMCNHSSTYLYRMRVFFLVSLVIDTKRLHHYTD